MRNRAGDPEQLVEAGELLVKRRVKACSSMRGAVSAGRAANKIQCLTKGSRGLELMLIHTPVTLISWILNQL
ncbi:hypothetical protein KC320_g159 [Hortaea werneckii]|nr:hypothetical protein KC320_g159 [Hortaea werneckii]